MKAPDVIRIMKNYIKCPDCSSDKLGNGYGGLIVEDNTFTRTCKCGFSITVDEKGDEVK